MVFNLLQYPALASRRRRIHRRWTSCAGLLAGGLVAIGVMLQLQEKQQLLAQERALLASRLKLAQNQQASDKPDRRSTTLGGSKMRTSSPFMCSKGAGMLCTRTCCGRRGQTPCNCSDCSSMHKRWSCTAWPRTCSVWHRRGRVCHRQGLPLSKALPGRWSAWCMFLLMNGGRACAIGVCMAMRLGHSWTRTLCLRPRRETHSHPTCSRIGHDATPVMDMVRSWAACYPLGDWVGHRCGATGGAGWHADGRLPWLDSPQVCWGWAAGSSRTCKRFGKAKPSWTTCKRNSQEHLQPAQFKQVPVAATALTVPTGPPSAMAGWPAPGTQATVWPMVERLVFNMACVCCPCSWSPSAPRAFGQARRRLFGCRAALRIG